MECTNNVNEQAPLKEVPPTYCPNYNKCAATFLSFMAAVNAVYREECTTGNNHGFNNNQADLLSDYDFIIVGGGTSGAILASRLSEMKRWTILVVESGGDADSDTYIPGRGHVLWGTPLDWHFKTVPQKYGCYASRDRISRLPKGKSLGGSTILDMMDYLRGNREDFDEWARRGNEGWSYAEVMPYFKMSEDNRNPEYARSIYHGVGGEQPVMRFPYKHPLVEPIIKGANQMGLPEIDVNAKYQIGVMNEQGRQFDGSRYSTARSFLHKIRCRSNLHIAKCAHTTKILVTRATRLAFGVEIMRYNRSLRIYARKEVILAAGVFNSPQLLMLSGIGPKKHLKEMGVRVIKDLMVGHNYQDQPLLLRGLQVITDVRKVKVQTDENYKRYKEEHEGPLAGKGVSQVIIYSKVTESAPANAPDILVVFASLRDEESIYKMGVDIGTNSHSYYEGFFMQPLNLVSKSVGEVKLQSLDPFKPPLIDPKYLSHPDDVELLLKSIRYLEKLVGTPSLKSIGADFNTTSLPGCRAYRYGTDGYWVCVIKHYTGTASQSLGTCKMGPRTDMTAVVNHDLKVHGVTNLRVIDESIIPKGVRGDTLTVTMMIGEKGAAMIKSSWA